MIKLIIFPMLLAFPLMLVCQKQEVSSIEFTKDLESFEPLAGLKEILQGVEIVALGENTHGLGEVFSTKAQLVKFLHQELGFDLLLMESGYGDGALAWEQIEMLSDENFTKRFTSNAYYHSEEIKSLIQYIKKNKETLQIQGFDCQPQQNFLLKRMTEITEKVDSSFSKSIAVKMRNFNLLYRHEYQKDTSQFYIQRDKFVAFLNELGSFIKKNKTALLVNGMMKNEKDAILKVLEIFNHTYADIEIGELMGWPKAYDIRDKSMLETIRWFKKNNPGSKIIIWAQNSHIENLPKPNYTVKWMGHSLKRLYGDKYYSIGAVVYKGENLTQNGIQKFEHNDSSFLAFHLNKSEKKYFILDLKSIEEKEFLKENLLGMENNGNTAAFIAKDRFDGLLFLEYSGPPLALNKD